VDGVGTVRRHHVQVHVAFDLVEELLVRVDVKVGALVGAADHHDDEVRSGGKHLLVAHRRLEQVLVFGEPAREAHRARDLGHGNSLR
jgi:hypothetical protein